MDTESLLDFEPRRDKHMWSLIFSSLLQTSLTRILFLLLDSLVVHYSFPVIIDASSGFRVRKDSPYMIHITIVLLPSLSIDKNTS